MSYTKIFVLGHVGADPEIRRLQNGATVASFSIATNQKVKGEETTSWWRCEAYQAADTGLVSGVIQRFVKRGSQIMVEGTPTQESWADKKTGEIKTGLKVRIGSLQLCGSRAGSQPAGDGEATPASSQTGVGQPADDSIPF